jgi:hypothetical protein
MDEDGHWEFYFTKIDGDLGSIFFNEGIAERAPVADHAALIYLRLFMRNPRPDGLSSNEEFDALTCVEEALEEALGGIDAIYVGRATYAGRRDFFFYATDGDRTVEAAATVMKQFPDYEIELGGWDEPDWKTYRDYLSPGAHDRQRIENRKVCELLEREGDPLTVRREIAHWAYFPNAAARDEFIQSTTQLGYTLRLKQEPDEAQNSFGACIVRDDHASWNEINEVTLELFDIATALGGDYDGWESPVEKS